MKLLDITLKDLLQSSRSFSIIIFMFVVPILVTLLFFVMFGGAGSEDKEGIILPRTIVVIANLDQGPMPTGFDPAVLDPDDGLQSVQGIEFGQIESMGALLAQIMLSDEFADLIFASGVADENSARSAVDNQDAGVAIIIPAGFSHALFSSEDTATIELYQDPTLTIGPAIVESILQQIVDNFSAGSVGANVAIQSLADSGVVINRRLIQEVVTQIASETRILSSSDDDGMATQITTEFPPGVDPSASLISQIVGLILGGMMVFFAFFTGAASMETILTEEERGTLARLFTTPTFHQTILGGKMLASLITLIVQLTVLLLFGRLVFGIDWGYPSSLALAAAGIVIIAAATGLFLVSMLKNTRQTGVVFGGVLTLTGMLGLLPVFTAGVPNQPEAVKTVSLLVPQGWAIRALVTAMDGGRPIDIVPILFVILLWSAIFAGIGQYRMQRRFS